MIYHYNPVNPTEQVQKDLGRFIIPLRHRKRPVAPNFYLEAKGPNCGTEIIIRQACHDSAIGARAMHKLQLYGQDNPVYDGSS